MHDEGFLGTLQGLMHDAALSKAVKHLLSDGIHDAMEDTIRKKLADLHPKAPPVKGDFPTSKWEWIILPGANKIG